MASETVNDPTVSQNDKSIPASISGTFVIVRSISEITGIEQGAFGKAVNRSVT